MDGRSSSSIQEGGGLGEWVLGGGVADEGGKGGGLTDTEGQVPRKRKVVRVLSPPQHAHTRRTNLTQLSNDEWRTNQGPVTLETLQD